MNSNELELEDDLRNDYDLTNLKVRKMGSGRKNFAGTVVRLEPDVATMFPNAEAVNEALRFLIRATQENSDREAILELENSDVNDSADEIYPRC